MTSVSTKILVLGALNANNTALFVCDLQKKFAGAINFFDAVIENSNKLINGCKLMDVPVIFTEQYPKGLGNTVEALNTENCQVVAKTAFNMLVPEVEQCLPTICENGLKSVVLLGVEAHVCVEQTAIDLISRGYIVHVVADCTSSRSQEDRLLALQRLQQIGCFITTSESVLFKLLKTKDHPKFKEIASLVKQLSVNTSLAPSSSL